MTRNGRAFVHQVNPRLENRAPNPQDLNLFHQLRNLHSKEHNLIRFEMGDVLFQRPQTNRTIKFGFD